MARNKLDAVLIVVGKCAHMLEPLCLTIYPLVSYSIPIHLFNIAADTCKGTLLLVMTLKLDLALDNASYNTPIGCQEPVFGGYCCLSCGSA